MSLDKHHTSVTHPLTHTPLYFHLTFTSLIVCSCHFLSLRGFFVLLESCPKINEPINHYGLWKWKQEVNIFVIISALLDVHCAYNPTNLLQISISEVNNWHPGEMKWLVFLSMLAARNTVLWPRRVTSCLKPGSGCHPCDRSRYAFVYQSMWVYLFLCQSEYFNLKYWCSLVTLVKGINITYIFWPLIYSLKLLFNCMHKILAMKLALPRQRSQPI